MNIQAQVDEYGNIKFSDPNLWGKKVTLTVSVHNGNNTSPINEALEPEMDK